MTKFFSMLYNPGGMFNKFAHFSEQSDEYISHVFPSIGYNTLICSVAIAAIFYVVINRFTSKFNSTKWWVIALLVNSVVCAFLSYYFISKFNPGSIDSFLSLQMLFNFLYGAIYFFIISLPLKMKNITVYAVGTPF